jgi:hypothetical protein
MARVAGRPAVRTTTHELASAEQCGTKPASSLFPIHNAAHITKREEGYEVGFGSRIAPHRRGRAVRPHAVVQRQSAVRGARRDHGGRERPFTLVAGLLAFAAAKNALVAAGTSTFVSLALARARTAAVARTPV